MQRNDREIRDRIEIQRVLEVAKVLRPGLTDGGYPYIVPLHYGYVYAGDVLRFYMHNAKEEKKLVLAMSNPHALVEFDCEAGTAGESDITCMYGTDYAGLMVRGEITVAEDPEKKIEGLKLLMWAQTDRNFEITAQQAAGVAVSRFDVGSYSVKEKKKKWRQLRQRQTVRWQHIKKAV